MKPYTRQLVIRPGAAQAALFACRDVAGTPIDLTGYGARAMVRGAYSDLQPLVSLTVGSGLAIASDPLTSTTSAVQLQITADQATAIATSGIGIGKWDLWLDPSGTPDATSFMLLRGDVLVEPTATR